MKFTLVHFVTVKISTTICVYKIVNLKEFIHVNNEHVKYIFKLDFLIIH